MLIGSDGCLEVQTIGAVFEVLNHERIAMDAVNHSGLKVAGPAILVVRGAHAVVVEGAPEVAALVQRACLGDDMVNHIL